MVLAQNGGSATITTINAEEADSALLQSFRTARSVQVLSLGSLARPCRKDKGSAGYQRVISTQHWAAATVMRFLAHLGTAWR